MAKSALLRQVLSEHFAVEESTLQPREPGTMSPDRVRSPHDPDVRLGRKRMFKWLGEQVHVVETADEDLNVVVGVLVTDPRREDSTVLGEARAAGLAEVPEADRLLADTGYASAANSLESEKLGVTLVSPPRLNTRQERFGPSRFEIEFATKTARCPAGHERAMWSVRKDGSVAIRWRDTACATCPLRDQCTTSKSGRRLHLSPHWERLEAERAQALGDEFRDEYRHRAGVETTMSELVRRHGLRRSRYRTAPGRRLHAILSVTALNAKRVIRWILTPNTEAIVARRLTEAGAACG
jgi:hypothetical protein